jgi:uncharacterized protein (DUF697 family)
LNRDTLLSVYDRLTGLVQKLPGGLQKPILQELMPIRQLFLEQRPARIMMAGRSALTAEQFLASLGAKGLEAGECDNGWRTLHVHGLGGIQVLDGREDASDELVKPGLERFAPDLVLFFWDSEMDEAGWRRGMVRLSLTSGPVIGLAGDRGAFRLQAGFAAEGSLSQRVVRVLNVSDPMCDEAICAALPLPAQLDFARITGARRAQAHIAGSLLKSFSAVCGVIGVQPIPLADMPILTTIQTLMVGMIIHTTGRPFSLRLVVEFIGALGFNVGAGLVLREGARALVRVVPIWGNAVSGFVAGAGTHAIGKAAIAYFIEGTPIQETRRIFKRLLPARLTKAKPPELPPG